MRAIITALMAMLVMQVDAFSVEPRALAAASILMEWRPKICVGASTSTSTACHHLPRHRQPRILTARSMSSIPDESEPSSMKRRKKVKGRVVGGDRLRESTGIRPSIHPTVINCISEALLLRSRNILGEPTSLFAEYMYVHILGDLCGMKKLVSHIHHARLYTHTKKAAMEMIVEWQLTLAIPIQNLWISP
jgi:hypothetical protein